MLIFNGKKYFVPLFVSPNGEANALPRQVIEGVKFVGKNGVVETGTLPYYDYEDMQADVLKGENGQVYIRSIVDGASVIEDEVYSIVPLWQFGNADPIYVAKGNHFTSADGFGIEGQAEIYDYTPIEASHKDETDTHYVFMGRVSVISFMEDEVLLKVPKSNFGNAQPSQVLEGVPFTSENGVSEVGTMPKVAMAIPTVNVDADDEESEIMIVSINNQQTGYAEKPPAPQSPPFTQSFVKLSINGNKAIMQCGDAKIERTVGASIATCTINVTFSTNAGNTLISATTFANGAISIVNHNIGNNNNGRSISIPNVVCGSALSINTSANRASLYWSGSKVGHYGLQGGTITVPSAAGTYSVEIGALDD